MPQQHTSAKPALMKYCLFAATQNTPQRSNAAKALNTLPQHTSALMVMLFHYIEVYYNRFRKHSFNKYLTPEEKDSIFVRNNKLVA
jgi:transposase InsO family protein